MPGYSYRYRRRYGRRYSRYRRYGAYSRYGRRRSGTSSTASSRGRIRVRVPVQSVVTMTIPANSTDSNVLTSSPYVYLTADGPQGKASACATPLYNAYTNLYDQVKCDGVVTRLSIVSPIGAGTAAAASALQVIVAYDRMGTSSEVNGASTPTTAQLFNFSSAVVRSAINNSVAKMSRSIWASDVQERTVFHDATVRALSSSAGVSDSDFASNTVKVNYFAPLTMIGLRLAAAAPTSVTTIQVLLEQTYYFTFRNPKYGGDASATQASFSTRPVVMDAVDARSLDREAGMADLGLDDEDAVAAAPVRSAPRRDMSIYWKDAVPTPLPQ